MPRGAIQLKNSFSRHVRFVPIRLKNTAAGRATTISTARNPAAAHRLICARSSSFSRADRAMNSMAISRIVSVSLNSTMWAMRAFFWLAMAMPMIVVAKRPLSWTTALLAVKAMAAKARATGTCR